MIFQWSNDIVSSLESLTEPFFKQSFSRQIGDKLFKEVLSEKFYTGD